MSAACIAVFAATFGGCTQPGAARLCEAIAAGDVAAAEQALKAGQVDVLRQQGLCHQAFDVLQSTDETSPRILAAMLAGGLDANATLSRSGGAPGRRSTTSTRSLIEWASGSLRHVDALLAGGLDVKSAAAGRAVALAANDGSLEVVQRLVAAGASVDEPLLDQYGAASAQTPLGLAVANRHHLTIAFLDGKGARFARGEVSPIFEAAWRGDVDVVRRATAAGVDVDAVDVHGQSPLLRAAGFGQTAVVAALVAARADVDAFFNGESALQAAASEGHAEVIRMLAKAGARVNGRIDQQARPALLRAVEGGRHDAVAVLIGAGADANLSDGGGTTPLAVAVRRRDARLVQALLPGKPKLDAVDASSGLPVLHSAVTGCEAQDFDVPLLHALVAAGAHLKATDAEGKTARQKAEASLHGETRPFYKACYEARVAALKALGG